MGNYYFFPGYSVLAPRKRHIHTTSYQLGNRKVPQLVSPPKDVASHSNVDDYGEENANPNRYVICIQANDAPTWTYPTPKLKPISWSGTGF